jgi:16S rRNA (guanine(966)-N(2))-methyltransferase RsmD
VGIEAISRGAGPVVFVERAHGALKVLRANLANLELHNGISVECGTVLAFLRRERGDAALCFDVVFLDPPYDAVGEYEAVLGLLGGASARLLKEDALVIAEHRRKERLQEQYGRLKRARLLEQGDAALSFYQVQEAEQAGEAE